ncbi:MULTISPECIES: 16S rRNA (cytosine(1402)-N(4))-methyltransferase RsmH [unclassified Mesorhizobium]|uniref:16S rRNA (cytosine(1402)-N(4))-methyltransferase RsmH n=2 Tax=Mesorhizobium TaxID=68287 RepID=UPI0007FF4AA2|nr:MULTISPECIES: 16S rRNA (cytosine(1402)-N(4))-methyltransferase RsmH [unclassified Mesorhizobium]OBQ90209.1 16S rRNA (cytosine(1402)-N(4))-methyltransferase [Mesorhizobium sp. AA23]RUV45627.1 16S rRNA (cytosine(1402)-N(4))-methyltransferase RsmH [Mesorhizobium sp. M1A.T.Ca.IN.004.03.1.1]RWI92016.1 MAG: 16S rRNA (cytosine(1402)-N(4))-methyltransferase RsmH [Mesorhizobium sp.]RWK39430.1 MAG: 16S rRNA (cytosine(1402)-N(4))-methyltransferase RsmH [Mesorhizobium sp.]RWK92490.1 MAG: 16S rRNA (cyto
MMTGHGDDLHAVGGLVRHIPVLLAEVLEALDPKAGETIVDGTFGAGGYTTAILERGASVVAIDRDPDAIAAGQALEQQAGGRLKLVQEPFSTLDKHVESADGVVLDIGVSSMQLDQAGRGFSFRADGPLDMRMAQAGLSAADVVNTFKAGDLARIFGFLGEERHAGRIARMIEARREKRPFERTLDLADAIATHVGRAPKDKIHPATRVFQALRIFVNDELGELASALFAAERVLKPGGRLAVVTFHSLEDRIVKRFIADRADAASGSRHMPDAPARLATFRKSGGGVTPGEAEIAGNPRARSARLRAAIRTGAPARAGDFSIFGLPKLPAVERPGER